MNIEETIGRVIFGMALGAFACGVIFLSAQNITNDSWRDGAIGVYEKTIVCEKSLDTWVCKREEK